MREWRYSCTRNYSFVTRVRMRLEAESAGVRDLIEANLTPLPDPRAGWSTTPA